MKLTETLGNKSLYKVEETDPPLDKIYVSISFHATDDTVVPKVLEDQLRGSIIHAVNRYGELGVLAGQANLFYHRFLAGVAQLSGVRSICRNCMWMCAEGRCHATPDHAEVQEEYSCSLWVPNYMDRPGTTVRDAEKDPC